MRKLASSTVLAISLFIASAHSNGQQNPAWLTKEFSAPAMPNQSIDSYINENTESFLNDTCQPSGLDGIQLISVQTGHNEEFHLHVYCRHDKAASTHYNVTIVPVPNHKVDDTANALLGNAKVRIGPLYLGSTGEPDAIVLIEKTQ